MTTLTKPKNSVAMRTETRMRAEYAELRRIEAVLKEFFPKVGLASDNELAAKSLHERVSTGFSVLLKTLGRVKEIAVSAGKKAGIPWTPKESLLGNLQALFKALSEEPVQGDPVITDAEALGIAKSLNASLQYPLGKLPASGARALKLVVTLVHQQRQR